MIPADSLWALVLARAEATPDALFAIDEADRRLDFAGLRDAGERVAAALHARGIGAGDAVSWILPTRTSAFVLMVALARLGAVQNPLVPIYRRREVGFCLEQTGARWLLVPSAFRGFDYAEMATGLARERPGLEAIVIDDPLPEADPDGLPAWRPEDAAGQGGAAPIRWIFYTSGTTSAPKGARHTDVSVLRSSEGLVRALDLGPGARTAAVFPITHLGGANALASTLQAGSTQLVVERFEPATTVAFLARHAVTHAGAGPAFYQAYLDVQRERPQAPIFPALRLLYGGGAPASPALRRAARDELGGLGVLSTYGMTECPVITMTRHDDPEEKRLTTEGRPLDPGTTIRIVDRDGRELPPGETGEIRVRAAQTTPGFVDAALDREAFDETGDLRTGDLGRLDSEGYLQIVGRIKDVIIRKGENVSAPEIEGLLAEHPKVAEVAVIGLPDVARGERVCAVVRDRAAAEPLAFEEMVSFLAARDLMRQKIPEQLEHVDALPRNPFGKVAKAELIARFS